MGFFAHGTTFSFGGSAVGGLTGIDLPDQSRDSVDLTDHDSGGVREFVAGLVDAGAVQLSGNNVPADTGQAALLTNFAPSGGATAACVITLANAAGSTISFGAFVNGMGGSAPFDSKGTWTASVKISGKVTVVSAPT